MDLNALILSGMNALFFWLQKNNPLFTSIKKLGRAHLMCFKPVYLDLDILKNVGKIERFPNK